MCSSHPRSQVGALHALETLAQLVVAGGAPAPRRDGAGASTGSQDPRGQGAEHQQGQQVQGQSRGPDDPTPAPPPARRLLLVANVTDRPRFPHR